MRIEFLRSTGLFPVDQRNLGPQLFGTVTTAIPDMKRHDLAGYRVHRAPKPVLVGVLLPNAPPLLGFGFQPSPHHGRGTGWDPDMSLIGPGGNARHHNMQEPDEADAHRTAEPTPRDALTPQVFHHGAPLIRQEAIVGRGANLAFARLTRMILLTMAGMAIFLVPACSTCWARTSAAHGCCWSPCFRACF